MIHLHDKTFEPFISSDEIDFAIKNLAKQMDDDFFDETPVFIGVLNGAFMVLSDLMKHYRGMCEVSFVKMASYQGTQSTNNVQELIGINQNLEGRTVVIVEDIIDTGNTIETLKTIFKDKKVKHLKIATLFFKPEAYKKDIKIDYIGIRIRNLQDVYQLKEN
jgi:hypoxanthine phosphoribosyltransferase